VIHADLEINSGLYFPKTVTIWYYKIIVNLYELDKLLNSYMYNKLYAISNHVQIWGRPRILYV